MKPVIQLEPTGCGIASVAAIAGVSYPRARAVANSLGIHAGDKRLWSDTKLVRTLLERFSFKAHRSEIPFDSWDALPNLALLATKWHLEREQPFWHWTVFVRVNGKGRVLDSKQSLRSHVRTDFGRIRPRWYIPVRQTFRTK